MDRNKLLQSGPPLAFVDPHRGQRLQGRSDGLDPRRLFQVVLHLPEIEKGLWAVPLVVRGVHHV
jgi:hypothetical protein